MAATMRATAVQPLDESLVSDLCPRLPLLGAAKPAKATLKGESFDAERAKWFLAIVGAAIDRTMPRKEAAYLMGVDAGNLTHQLAGDAHLSAWRLGALPPPFFVALIDGLRAHYGIDEKRDRVRQASEMLSQAMAILIAETQR
jgi:hypothetical protein